MSRQHTHEHARATQQRTQSTRKQATRHIFGGFKEQRGTQYRGQRVPQNVRFLHVLFYMLLSVSGVKRGSALLSTAAHSAVELQL
jgi:hypothetical protein